MSAITHDGEEIRNEVKSIPLDLHVIEGALFSYLGDIEAADPASAAAFRERLDSDISFARGAQQATMDAIMFSTFANTVDAQVFEESLTMLAPLDGEPELQRMRAVMFDFGIALAATNGGGARTTGRLKRCAENFHAAAGGRGISEREA